MTAGTPGLRPVNKFEFLFGRFGGKKMKAVDQTALQIDGLDSKSSALIRSWKNQDIIDHGQERRADRWMVSKESVCSSSIRVCCSSSHADDAVERRSDFMAHVCEKF